MRLFVAESDPALGTFLKTSFEAEKYSVDWAPVAGDGAPLLAQYDAAVLDLNAPGEESLATLRSVRARSATLPILALAMRARPDDRAKILDSGADDLVVKPFAFSELSARLRALLRRRATPSETVLRIDDLELSRVEHTVKRGGRKIELTPKEFSLLEYLMQRAGQRVTRAEIVERVWNLSFDTMTNVVDVYINYLRKKVDAASGQKLIHTIRGIGYELEVRRALPATPSDERGAWSESEEQPVSNGTGSNREQ